jgi:amidase
MAMITDPPEVPVDTVGAFMGRPSLMARGAADGPLGGLTVAVKDLLDVAGTVTLAGNPDFGRTRVPAERHAVAVERLVHAGATVVGRTITDELAYSLSGTNRFFGTPVNVAAPQRIPGGSSAGSAAAVAAGLVDLGLGTDTAGSVRVPASYCGIWGWRSTHGSVPLDGVVPLAPSFDTVGLFARDPNLLLQAAATLMGRSTMPPARGTVRFVRFAEAFAAVQRDVADAAAAAIDGWECEHAWLGVDLDEALAAQRTVQQFEAWQTHGPWITAARPSMGPGIAARFHAASRINPDDMATARPVANRIGQHLRQVLEGDGQTLTVLVLPAAAGVAPLRNHSGGIEEHEHHRANTLRLTCSAGLAGAPVVVAPLARLGALPLGVAFISAPGTDIELLATLCARISTGER